MSYAGENDIKLILTTVDGREGWCWLSRPDDMSWDEEGDDETECAEFEQYGFNGEIIDSVTITGDEWRQIEDNGREADILFWTRRWLTLREAVQAAILGVDPDGRDGDTERDLADAKDRIAELTSALLRAYFVLEAVVIDPALYGMKITDPEHPWHEDVMAIRKVLEVTR